MEDLSVASVEKKVSQQEKREKEYFKMSQWICLTSCTFLTVPPHDNISCGHDVDWSLVNARVSH